MKIMKNGCVQGELSFLYTSENAYRYQTVLYYRKENYFMSFINCLLPGQVMNLEKANIMDT